MENPKNSTKTVWIYGSIGGICLNILCVVPFFVAHTAGSENLQSIVAIIGFFMMFVLLPIVVLLTGLLASKQAGQVHTGTLAGLVAGGIAGISALMCGADPLVVFLPCVAGVGFGALGGLMGNLPKGSAKKVWTYGSIGGVYLSFLWFGLAFIALFPGEWMTGRYSDLVSSIIGFIWEAAAIVLTAAAFLLTGLFASKQTGRVRTGTLAGLVAGSSGVIILWVVLELIFYRTETRIDMARVWFLLGVLVMLSIGAGIGTLGGLIGKRRAKVPPVSSR